MWFTCFSNNGANNKDYRPAITSVRKHQYRVGIQMNLNHLPLSVNLVMVKQHRMDGVDLFVKDRNPVKGWKANRCDHRAPHRSLASRLDIAISTMRCWLEYLNARKPATRPNRRYRMSFSLWVNLRFGYCIEVLFIINT